MQKLLEKAVFAAISAGEKISQIYEEEYSIDLKPDLSPITIADKAGHGVISEHLKQTDIPVLSEEGSNISYQIRADWTEYWLVDPLDGTKEFISRNGEFTVNIALIRNGVPVLGVVYAPVMQWLYIGMEGEGSWKLELENHKLPSDWRSTGRQMPFERTGKENFTVVGSRSHSTRETDEYIASLESIHSKLDFISMGSSLKLCLVAEGSADIYPRLAPTMEWDTAAGDAIARSAGCKVLRFETSEPLQYNKENLLNPWFIVQR